ncbi:hypothetical protein HPB50_000180 [Hyalomma asiaticum]|uniref:Uncharacterized protein n=1 Tax=Hyalomma asiaticum TaxID=266040 RepID=A0ACB7TCJ8_HYAAI|nr:hypothetical protein HPB50_000180 [Hyalomma asiaticum]
MTDAEIVHTATNGADGGNGDNDKPPREAPTSAETRNLLCLLRNKVECSGGKIGSCDASSNWRMPF